ncbi:MAG: lamin tail domain-containing protein [Verrucomicrobiae bacterium]|nr:lamin tail domain-containing protein [Verrucomicrobiae bacterium]
MGPDKTLEQLLSSFLMIMNSLTLVRAISFFATTAVAVTADVVINEIHYDPADKTVPDEFVELYNSGAQTVDISGWRLGGVGFTFPPNTSIAPEAFLIVAESPETLLASFGAQALGPWAGSLSNGGEKLSLEDASGKIVDVVDYQSGYPWPSRAAGGGSSMELINPSLDNDLAGSWRSSQPPGALPELTYISSSADGWHFKKGTAEASDPIDAWRLPEYDAAAWEMAKLPVGFGGVGSPGVEWSTELADMQSSYSSVFLRSEFEVAPGEIPSALQLGYIIDDGVVVWINGTEVFRLNVTDEPSFDTEASASSKESNTLTKTEITGVAGAFREGTNVIAIQAFNGTIGGSDFGVDIELVRPTIEGGAPDPTPGRPNSVLADNLPPQTRQVSHTPNDPKAGDAVTVSVKVTDADGVAALSLSYQVVEPGAYIRKTDDGYEDAASWTTISMTLSTTEADTYIATIPADVQLHRRLVRYRISATDNAGLSVTIPYADDEQPNFAYYVYNGVPEWSGADRPGTSETVKFPIAALTHLPVYQLIADATDVNRSQYQSAFEGRHFFGTLVYDGVVYDHIEFSNRGEFSTYQSGKNKWRIHFTRNHDLIARDNYGKKYATKIKTMNMNACASPWVPANRGMAGMEEALGFKLYQLAGTPAPDTHWLHFRVVDDAEEAPADSQYNGDLWGLYLFVEYPDSRFLSSRKLPDGNTYKIEGGSGDKKNQGPTQPTNTSDWTSFLGQSRRAQTTEWWRENFDLSAYYGFRAVNRIVGNIDIREGWNHYFYHNPDGHWAPIPWDLDMLTMPETHWSGTIDQKACLRNDDIEIEFKNRCRELVDLLVSDKGDFGGQVAQVVEELATIVNPPDLALTMVDVDQFMWNNHPKSTGGHKGAFYRTPMNQSFQGGVVRRVLATADHEGYEKYLKDFTTDTDQDGWKIGDGDQNGYGFEYLSLEANDDAIPQKPMVTYSGGVGFPLDQLRFSSDAYTSATGTAFGTRQWRIARIYNPATPDYEAGTPWKYEMETVWDAEPIIEVGTTTVQIPADALKPGATYRVRSRVLDSGGRASHWSDAVEFVAGTPDTSPYNGLAITEVMYYPSDASDAERAAGFTTSDFEFIEIHNSGTTPIDLTVLSITKGVDFDFADGTLAQLAPGDYALIVADAAAFAARYGAGMPVAGQWGNDKLSNSGETIAITFGKGNVVLEFAYEAAAPWPVAMRGQSLVLNAGGDPTLSTSWVNAAPSPGSDGENNPGGGGYAVWATSYFGSPDAENAAPDLDADGDGAANAVEFVLVSDPLNRGSVPELIIGFDSGRATLTFTQLVDSDGYKVTAEMSTNLNEWQSATITEIATSPVEAIAVSRTWRIESDLTDVIFLRLRIAEP